MLNIVKLFSRSPFAPLQKHMDKVSDTVELLPPLFSALQSQGYARVDALADQISEEEHAADLIKNDIRNHLPKSLFLSIDRQSLLEMISLQDSIADHAEDIAVLVTLKRPKFPPFIKELFPPFIQKHLDVFVGTREVMRELDELMEASFGGPEAEKVHQLVRKVSLAEHEADLVQRPLLQALLQEDTGLHYTDLIVWQGILRAFSTLANISEKLANRMRMTLEI